MAKSRTRVDHTPAQLDTAVQVAQLIAARSKSWADYNGTGIDNYLQAAGLLDTVTTNRREVTVDLGAAWNGDLTAPAVLNVTVDAEGNPDPYSLMEATRMHLYNNLLTVPAETYTVTQPAEGAIDPREYLGATFGSYAFNPVPFGTDEARAEASRIVAAAMAEAQRMRACSTPEDMVRRIGFGDFLPPAETAMTVELEGFGTVAFTVENDRMGQPRQDRMAVKIRQAISDRLAEDIASGKVIPMAMALAADASA